ncbi:three-prime repair exonuclease 1 [Drosophila miranda]|uniref:three-prime repair exonuclease 1 n=1 Tax=Drosophila miranda TaxID=7229 RepID=UPI0007E72081|nr:three-prime repair exonuclease 1 [Drosophila miranda]
MTPSNSNDGEQYEDQHNISTFAVLDLETTNLPANNNNRVGITELCIYAFEAALLKQNGKEGSGENKVPVPPLPRVVHKLNVLFQPSMMVHPDAERFTGLNNYILERESKLDENSAQMILNFLEHLPSPVCLVAHNGWHFDFPIVRKAFAKLNLEFSPTLTCVDSLRAFLEIDDKQSLEDGLMKLPQSLSEKVEEAEPLSLERNESAPKSSILTPTENASKQISGNVVDALEASASGKVEEAEPIKEPDWRMLNETTPKRPILTPTKAASKRRQISESEDDELEASSPVKRTLSSRRQLFSGLKCAQKKRWPPRGKYNLGSLYERKFNQPPTTAHQAEADVAMVTALIQHYGMDFRAFAEEQAIPFSQIIPLGSPARRK